MLLRLLGPMDSSAGSPRQRLLLAALAVDAGRPVPVETLVDRIWGEDPPAQARRTLHSYIARLRAALPEPFRPVRGGGGYLLSGDPDTIDLHRFRRLAAEATAVSLRAAAELWRGDALSGLAGDWADRTRNALRYERIAAVVAWATAEVDGGDPSAVLGPVAALAAENPLVEPLAAALARVLVALGRPAEALEHLTATRDRLGQELGADPGPELDSAYQEALRVTAGPTPSYGTLDREPAPRQLPYALAVLAGRQAEIARLDGLLAGRGPGDPTLIVAIAGTAGVGKTTLAVHWARRVGDRFPDGHLFANLHGFAPGGTVTDPGEVIRGFLGAFGVPPERIPADVEGQAALYRSTLDGRRVLIVLDNVRDPDQVRPLLPGGDGCLVVATSRSRLTGLVAAQGARSLPLGVLAPAQARRLLAGRLGETRMAEDPEAVRVVVAACAGLPLALSVAAARSELGLSGLAEQLREERGRLDALDGGDPATDVRAVFSWSYRSLSPDAGRLFRLLGLHPAAEFGRDAAASLAAVTPREAAAMLAELARGNLITEAGPDRFVLHDLLREYAAELGAEPGAEARLLDHYLHTAARASTLIQPHRDDPVTLPAPVPGVIVPALADHRAALDWFAARYPVLIELAARAWPVAWALTPYLDRSGRWHDGASVQAAALRAAADAGDVRGQAVGHVGLAYAYIRLRDQAAAQDHLRAALALYEKLDDKVGQGHVHRTFTWSLDRQDRSEDALEHARLAHDLFTAGGHRSGQARALNAMGWFQLRLGDPAAALVSCTRAVERQREVGDRFGQADTLDSLGRINRLLGRHAEAIEAYRAAVALYRDFGDRYNEADTLLSLGDVQGDAGDPGGAADAWRLALYILEDLGHQDAERAREKLRAVPETDSGR